ncbi:MAG: hypothetical protein OHK0039_06050 [Bacteroidia bacterium]
MTACVRALPQPDVDPLILIEDPATGQVGYRDATGHLQIAAGKYAYCLTDTFRTHAIVLRQDDPRWVVIDRREQVLYEIFPYDNGPDEPAEGLFRIIVDGRIGYADAETFAIVIAPQFDCAFPFEDGRAKVSTDCQTVGDGEYSSWASTAWRYVNRQGQVVD